MAKNNTDIIVMGEEWFRKAPAIPTNGREVLVKITPWVALIFGILGIVTGIAGLGVLLGAVPLGVMTGHDYGVTVILSLALGLVASMMMVMAFQGTLHRRYKGWTLLFWAEVVTVISQLVSFNILGAIIGGLIGFYLLYQIKSYYK